VVAGTALALGDGDMRSEPPARGGLSVTIVSSNPETLTDLEAYLQSAGVSANGTRLLDRMLEMTPPSSAAVILFPDEFQSETVLKALAALGGKRPEVLAVIVTNEPRRFERPAPMRSESAAALVIPKPAWAWTILDAIRARLNGGAHGANT
jgi:hypothetical protein